MTRTTPLPADKFLVEHKRGAQSWVVEVAAESPEDAARHVANFAQEGLVPSLVSRMPAPSGLLHRFLSFAG